MRAAAGSLILLFGLAACAGPSGVSPSGGLMYDVPQPSSLVYITGDTANIDIDAGAMGSMTMRQTSEATVAMSFAETMDGIQVTATYEDLSARVSNPMGAPQSVSEADVEGDLVFTIDRQGKATLGTLPDMSAEAEAMASPHTLVYEFFPRLPGGAVSAGDMWTDTISYEASMQQGDMVTTSILTYTLMGDTVVDGSTLLHITYEGDTEARGSAVTEGMEMFQTMAGDVTGMFLWDPARSVVVMGEAMADLDGNVEVPAAGVPAMPMRVTARSHVKLQRN